MKYRTFTLTVLALPALIGLAATSASAQSNSPATPTTSVVTPAAVPLSPVDQVKQDNSRIRRDNANINYQKGEVAADNTKINKDKARVETDQDRLARERAARNTDQRREDADIKKGNLTAAQAEDARRVRENQKIGATKRNEQHAVAQEAALRKDRGQENKELEAARDKKGHDVHKRNKDASKIN